MDARLDPTARPGSLAAEARAPAPPAPGTLLRFITCGSVDDGKSTLIGRLLHEAGAIPDDQAAALARDSRRFGTTGEAPDYALLVDGLAAEREQGITIDVAYRYFAGASRSFIVADTPGHEQYTRNMATGASTADLALILVDARKGLLPQTRRHAYIVSLVGVRHVVLVVNKMDLAGYDAGRFAAIAREFCEAVAHLGFASITAIPVSALAGDNITAASAHMPWYEGPALLPLLEHIDPGETAAGTQALLPVQWVNRPDHGFRGFSGTLAGGPLRRGSRVMALPSGVESTVSRILGPDGDLDTALPGQAITVVLGHEIDLSRGDVLATPGAAAQARRLVTARLLVTAARSISPGDSFLIKVGTATANATVASIDGAINVETYAERPAPSLALNDIGPVTLRLDRPLVMADYGWCRELGGFILIDRLTNDTAAFGVIGSINPADVPQAAPVARTATAAGSLPARWLTDRALRQTASWRVLSGLGLAAAVLAITGRPALAAASGLADMLLRGVMRPIHDAAWKQRRTAGGAGAAEDGGGI